MHVSRAASLIRRCCRNPSDWPGRRACAAWPAPRRPSPSQCRWRPVPSVGLTGSGQGPDRGVAARTGERQRGAYGAEGERKLPAAVACPGTSAGVGGLRGGGHDAYQCGTGKGVSSNHAQRVRRRRPTSMSTAARSGPSVQEPVPGAESTPRPKPIGCATGNQDCPTAARRRPHPSGRRGVMAPSAGYGGADDPGMNRAPMGRFRGR
jgi:hypothetical protein